MCLRGMGTPKTMLYTNHVHTRMLLVCTNAYATEIFYKKNGYFIWVRMGTFIAPVPKSNK